MNLKVAIQNMGGVLVKLVKTKKEKWGEKKAISTKEHLIKWKMKKGCGNQIEEAFWWPWCWEKSHPESTCSKGQCFPDIMYLKGDPCQSPLFLVIYK
jgi:hypothetical protein